MAWDAAWEAAYRSREWGRYPPEELIRFIARHYYGVPHRKSVRILEIGCGAGANLWYLEREGFDAWGIDGSQEAIRAAINRVAEDGHVYAMAMAGAHPARHFRVGDAVRLAEYYSPAYFDAVIDVCCLQHNNLVDTRTILEHVHKVLKPGGRVFSMMVGADSWGACTGTKVEAFTWTDIPVGPAMGLGLTRFVTPQIVGEIFAGFEDVAISHSSRTLDSLEHRWSHWVIEGRKPE